VTGAALIDDTDADEDRAATFAAHLDVILFALDELRGVQAAERKRHEATWAWQAEALAGIERMVGEIQRRVRETGSGVNADERR